VNIALVKRLLISALAASMVVGCAELPTSHQDQTPSSGAEQTAITTQSLKALLSEVKQTLASLRTVNGASQTVASAASGYRLSSYAIAQTNSPWAWEYKTLGDGTVEMTRHVIETDASETVVTDIRSTRREKLDGKTRTYSQEDVVTKSAYMQPGTYQVEGSSTSSGSMGQADFKAEIQQTTTFTPLAGGSPTSTTLKSTYTPSLSRLTLSGTLPDGATIAYDSSTEGTYVQGQPTVNHQTMTLAVTSPSGKTFVVENGIDNLYSQTETGSTSEAKGFYQVSLGTQMKVRFSIDVVSQGTRVDQGNGGYTYTYTFPRNEITAELQDGAGKLIVPIALETSTDHSKPPTKGTIQLEGEAASELDMSFMMDIQKVQMSLPYQAF
jgi:hypothetical protein